MLVLTKVFLQYTRLPENAYTQWSIGAQLVLNSNILLTGAVLVGAAVLCWRGALLARWQVLPQGRQLCVFVVLLQLVLTYPFVSYGYNHYFDQAHLLDRIVLLLLALATINRPAFVFPFIGLLMAMIWQFAEPGLGGSIFAHKLQVVYPLILFAAAWLVYAVTRRFPMRTFVVLTSSLVAAAYWQAAVAKHALNWLQTNELHLIIPAAFNHGWLGTMTPQQINQLALALAPLDAPLQYLVMFVEAACVIMLAQRRWAMGLLAALITFHAGVFAYYGFLFWTWATLNAALIWLLASCRPDVFGWRTVLLTAPLIVFGATWAHAPALGWLDTRIGYTYQLQATTLAGEEIRLAPGFFAPYEDAFTMTGFSYLSPHAVLTGPYAVSHDAELAARLRSPLDITQLQALEADQAPGLDSRRAAVFTGFVRRFVVNRRNNGNRHRWLSYLPSLPQFWGWRTDEQTDPAGKISRIRVIEVTTAFGPDGPVQLRRLQVANITIPSG